MVVPVTSRTGDFRIAFSGDVPDGSRPESWASGRVTGAPPERYSRFVLFLRIVLPLMALMLVVALAVWPSLYPKTAHLTREDIGRLEMVKARYYSIDKDNQPFSIIADDAVQGGDDPDLVNLTLPEAEMTQGDGSWVFLKGRRGLFNQKTGILRLNDEVVVMHDDGYEFLTQEAFVQVRDGTAWGQEAVRGHGPFGEIEARGFRILDKGEKLLFSGQSSLLLPGSSAVSGGGPP